MRTIVDVICTDEACSHVRPDTWVNTAEAYPACEMCGGQTRRRLVSSNSAHVHGDDIPGGVVIYNGACWPDGSPRRHYSKSSIAKAARENGWEPGVRHAPQPKSGSDKNKHTQRFV